MKFKTHEYGILHFVTTQEQIQTLTSFLNENTQNPYGVFSKFPKVLANYLTTQFIKTVVLNESLPSYVYFYNSNEIETEDAIYYALHALGSYLKSMNKDYSAVQLTEALKSHSALYNHPSILPVVEDILACLQEESLTQEKPINQVVVLEEHSNTGWITAVINGRWVQAKVYNEPLHVWV